MRKDLFENLILIIFYRAVEIFALDVGKPLKKYSLKLKLILIKKVIYFTISKNKGESKNG